MAEDKKLKELTEDELKNVTGGGNDSQGCNNKLPVCPSGMHWDSQKCKCVSNVNKTDI